MTQDLPGESAQPVSLGDLQAKARLQGTVTETYLHGAAVDIGLEYHGMIHISQLSPRRVNRVRDVVNPGDTVIVWVTKVNAERGHIGLTMIEPPAVDWQELAQGQVHRGIVTRLEPYGAFVDIGAERAGLLHVREMSSGYVRHPSELVKIGDEVEVRIVNYDRRKRRIDLSMMGIEPEAEEEQDEEAPMRTSMEIALHRAQAGQDDVGAPDVERQERSSSPDLSDREEILARTLEQHARR